jgi:hypothetical protein
MMLQTLDGIRSPLDGFPSPLAARRGGVGTPYTAAYAANSIDPELVTDFASGFYAQDSAASTYGDLLTYTGDSLKTMVYSDGALKWAPHNLVTYSTPDAAEPTNWTDFAAGSPGKTLVTLSNGLPGIRFQPSGDRPRISQNVISVVAGDEFTAKVFVEPGYTLAPGGGTVNDVLRLFVGGGADLRAALGDEDADGILTVEYTATNSGTLIVQYGFGLDGSAPSGDATLGGIHVFRSDLGGMADNPDRGDSYVPTTSSDVYMGRVGHHKWNGSAWVNKGLLLESEARTNLLLNSGTLSTQNVTVSAVQYVLTFTGTGTVTLSGASTAGPLVGAGTGENNRVQLAFTPSAGTLTCTVSGTVTNAQLEAVSAAVPYTSSHIPTSGATVARAVGTNEIAGADMPASTADYSLSAHMEIDRAAGQEMILADWRVDANNRVTVKVNTSNAVVLEHVRSGTTVTVTGGTISGGQGVACNWAIRVTASAANIAVNGTAATEAAVGGTIDLSMAAFEIPDEIMGTISEVRGFAADIADTGIEEASS